MLRLLYEFVRDEWRLIAVILTVCYVFGLVVCLLSGMGLLSIPFALVYAAAGIIVILFNILLAEWFLD